MASKNEEQLALSAGVQAYALVRALMDHMEDRKVLSDRDVLGIIEAAHRKVDLLRKAAPQLALAMAATSLAGEADTVRKRLRPMN